MGKTGNIATLEQKKCLVCGEDYDTGNILLDRRLKESFEMHTLTGSGVCKTCSKEDEGYRPLLEFDVDKSEFIKGELVGPYLTGRVIHIKNEAFEKIFDMELDDSVNFNFVELGVIENLEDLMKDTEDEI